MFLLVGYSSSNHRWQFPQGTDQTMLNKLHKTHGDNVNYLKPKSDMNASFGMNHFAGVVFYDARGFLEKNRDSFSADLMQIVHSSTNKFMHTLFQEDLNMGSGKRPCPTARPPSSEP